MARASTAKSVKFNRNDKNLLAQQRKAIKTNACWLPTRPTSKMAVYFDAFAAAHVDTRADAKALAERKGWPVSTVLWAFNEFRKMMTA